MLNKTLAQYLQIQQYPTRTRAYGRETQPAIVQYKPVSKVIEYQLPLNTSPASYDADRGLELAQGWKNSDSSKMNRIVLQGKPVVSSLNSAAHYIGLLDNSFSSFRALTGNRCAEPVSGGLHKPAKTQIRVFRSD